MSDVTRVPCPKCGAAIIEGARKCRGCGKWLQKPPGRARRVVSALCVLATLVMGVVVATGESPVGEAPPLTPLPLGADENMDVSSDAVDDNGFVPQGEPRELAPVALTRPPEVPREWRSRTLQLDVHPLDILFSADGQSIFVSGDDASLREYDAKTGRLRHMASVPAQGDRLRLLHDRYVAVIRRVDAAMIPVMDTHNWDRDPMLLWVGARPSDIVALPDGKTVVTASSRGKRLTWYDLKTGMRLGDMRVPHSPRALYLLEIDDRPYIGALGTLQQGGRHAGAFLDIFDPSESPFGATRRSVAVGRDPSAGAVSSDGARLFVPDRVSNAGALLDLSKTTRTLSATVGQAPVAGFVMNADQHAVTLDAESRTATVIDLAEMERATTLMLTGAPSTGATSRDGRVLAVSLGGDAWPPKGSGAAIIGGSPPELIATLSTGRGASRVAVAADGTRAAVACYQDKAITVIEPIKR